MDTITGTPSDATTQHNGQDGMTQPGQPQFDSQHQQRHPGDVRRPG